MFQWQAACFACFENGISYLLTIIEMFAFSSRKAAHFKLCFTVARLCQGVLNP